MDSDQCTPALDGWQCTGLARRGRKCERAQPQRETASVIPSADLSDPVYRLIASSRQATWVTQSADDRFISSGDLSDRSLDDRVIPSADLSEPVRIRFASSRQTTRVTQSADYSRHLVLQSVDGDRGRAAEMRRQRPLPLLTAAPWLVMVLMLTLVLVLGAATDVDESSFSGYQVLRVLVLRRDTADILRSYQDRAGERTTRSYQDRTGKRTARSYTRAVGACR